MICVDHKTKAMQILVSSLLYQIVNPSSAIVSPVPVHLTSANPTMSHGYLASSCVNSLTSPQAYNARTFQVAMTMPSCTNFRDDDFATIAKLLSSGVMRVWLLVIWASTNLSQYSLLVLLSNILLGINRVC